MFRRNFLKAIPAFFSLPFLKTASAEEKTDAHPANPAEQSPYYYTYVGDAETGCYKKMLRFPVKQTVYHKNSNGDLHCADGPAVIYENGDKYWFRNNQLHRLDGPAIEFHDGTEMYCINGKRFTKEEFNNYNTPRIDANGTQTWHNELGQLHRENGPAVICPNGTKIWFLNGNRHRVGGI